MVTTSALTYAAGTVSITMPYYSKFPARRQFHLAILPPVWYARPVNGIERENSA
jgi:hypothetical protein